MNVESAHITHMHIQIELGICYYLARLYPNIQRSIIIRAVYLQIRAHTKPYYHNMSWSNAGAFAFELWRLNRKENAILQARK